MKSLEELFFLFFNIYIFESLASEEIWEFRTGFKMLGSNRENLLSLVEIETNNNDIVKINAGERSYYR